MWVDDDAGVHACCFDFVDEFLGIVAVWFYGFADF